MDPEYDLSRLRRAQRVTEFVRLVEAAYRGDMFTIVDHEMPVAVVLGIREFKDLKTMATDA